MHDLEGADVLLPNIIEKVQCILADKAYDAKVRVLDLLDKAKVQFVIPPRKNRKEQREYNKEKYKWRHLIENFFAKLKQFRAIATRYDERACAFLGGIYLAAILICLN